MSFSRKRPHLVVLSMTVAATSCVLAACGSSSSGTSAASTTSGPAMSATPESGKIIVFAAASLTGTFTTLGRQFEAAHPGTTVAFDFGASSTLAAQIVQGAPADVFASAAPKNMDQVVTAKDAADPTVFATNDMEIAVPPGNPAKITNLSDLAGKGVKVVLCAAAVPCGVTARKVFTNAGLTVTPVSDEADVKSTLTKVELGEADAGIVYVTDVLAAGSKVRGITIPAAVNATTSYPIAALTHSQNHALATAFVDYVLSADGEAVLAGAGFAKP